jgi:hypothetical protein
VKAALAAVSPGLARLRASPNAEAIRQSVIADNRAAIAEIAVSRADPAVDCAPKAPAAPAKPADLSEGATVILRALFQVAADGGWIDQKAIPHGMTGKAVPAYLGGLYKRKLVDLRGDGGGKFSAKMTLAGVAVLADLVEAGR